MSQTATEPFGLCAATTAEVFVVAAVDGIADVDGAVDGLRGGSVDEVADVGVDVAGVVVVTGVEVPAAPPGAEFGTAEPHAPTGIPTAAARASRSHHIDPPHIRPISLER